MSRFLFSQVIYGPRRGPTFNNRWWNDRRSWNLRISIREGEGVPKGGRTTPCLAPVRPLRGRQERVSVIRRFHSLRSFHQRLFTFAPFGDGSLGCPIAFSFFLSLLSLPFPSFSFLFPQLLYPFYTAFSPFYTISAFHYTPTILFSQTFGNASFIP